MSVEQAISKILSGSQQIDEAAVKPVSGQVEPNVDRNNTNQSVSADDKKAPVKQGSVTGQASKAEPRHTLASKTPQGSTPSKKANQATAHASAPEAMKKLREGTEIEDSDVEEMIDFVNTLTEEDFRALSEEDQLVISNFVEMFSEEDESDDAVVGEDDVDHAMIEEMSEHEVDPDSVEEFLQSEEADQLDELSRKTLASYVRKAKDDVSRKAHERDSKANRAPEKLSKEEFEVDVTEDVNALLEGESTLTEEFKEKAATIFEAAVVTRVKEELQKIEEAYKETLNGHVEEIRQELVEHIDGYLDLVVEKWIEDNEIALERGLKSEILEEFVEGLKGLFEEHYIDIPDEKFDVVSSMEDQLETVEEKYNEAVNENVELRKHLAEMVRHEIIREAATGLSDTQAEKLQMLAEEITFGDPEEYQAKVQTIRESYFSKKSSGSSKVIDDQPTTLTEASGVMSAYVEALGRTPKFN